MAMNFKDIIHPFIIQSINIYGHSAKYQTLSQDRDTAVREIDIVRKFEEFIFSQECRYISN